MSLTKRVRRREPAALAVLGEVGAGQHADRRADQRAGADHQQAADDGVGRPPSAPGRRRRLREERGAQGRRSPRTSSVPRIQSQPEQAEGERSDGQADSMTLFMRRRRR